MFFFTNLIFAQVATASEKPTDTQAAPSVPAQVGNALPVATPNQTPATAPVPAPSTTENTLPTANPQTQGATPAQAATSATIVVPQQEAEAKPAKSQGLFGEGFMNFLPFLLIIVAMWIFLIRPQQKRDKELRKRQSELKTGDHVITTAGIHGKVVSIDADRVLLQVADGVRIRFERQAIITFISESKDEKPAKS